jgi:glycosyltransferase involved in cell wall biosynthesis
MNYFVTPYGRNGASSRVRVWEWLDRIPDERRASGYAAQPNARPRTLARHPGAVIAAERRLRRMAGARPDRLLLHREASPLSRGHLERRLLAAADFAVYDLDDALQWDRGQGGFVRRLAPKAPKAVLAARAADRVIAGSPVLADWASDHNDDVVLIPSCVSPDAYTAKTDYRVSDPPRLGWIGSPDNEIYLRLLEPVLFELNRQLGARVTIIGTTRATLGGLERLIDRIPWSEVAQRDALAELDVGLFPLPDEPYTRGKCAYKLLQYAAAGVPAVAAPVGVNTQILAELGMPAATAPAEWLGAVLELLDASVEARSRLGQRARELIVERYSYDAWESRWRHAVGLPAGG